MVAEKIDDIEAYTARTTNTNDGDALSDLKHEPRRDNVGNLNRNLKSRHIQFLALSGAIGMIKHRHSVCAESNGGQELDCSSEAAKSSLLLGRYPCSLRISLLVSTSSALFILSERWEHIFPYPALFPHSLVAMSMVCSAKCAVESMLTQYRGFGFRAFVELLVPTCNWRAHRSYGLGPDCEVSRDSGNTLNLLTLWPRSYWPNSVHVGLWITIFWVPMVVINLFPVRFYGEAEVCSKLFLGIGGPLSRGLLLISSLTFIRSLSSVLSRSLPSLASSF
jgi:hypothetical protein